MLRADRLIVKANDEPRRLIMAGMRQETAIDGFRLAYERTGRIGRDPRAAAARLAGGRTDYREVVPLVSAAADVIVPDLRGFGESDKHEADPARQYNATAQARSVIGLIDELALGRPVIAGYDIGSRIAQAIARDRPDLVRALVIAPPLPGIGDRILAPQAQREFWYQAFHNIELSTQLVDGQPDAVRAYLRHFWSHWSGPGYEPCPRSPRSPGVGLRAAGRVRRLDRLVPGGRGVGRRLPGGAGSRPGRPDRGTRYGAVARTRSAVPPRMVRPDR